MPKFLRHPGKISRKFSPSPAYTGGEPICKGGTNMHTQPSAGGDVDDLIFQDAWCISQR